MFNLTNRYGHTVWHNSTNALFQKGGILFDLGNFGKTEFQVPDPDDGGPGGWGPGYARSRATALNNKGQIVGSSVINKVIWDDERYFYATHAFIWDQRNKLQDLNKLVVNMDEWEYLSGAYDINDKGQIVGSGIKKNGPGWSSAFILNPIK